MIRYCNLYLPSRAVAAVFIDSLFICVAAMLLLRAPNTSSASPSLPLLLAVLVTFAVAVPILYLCELYDFDAPRKPLTTLLQGLRAIGASLLVVMPLLWIFGMPAGTLRADARVLETGLLLLLAALCCFRIVSDWLYSHLRPRHAILLVGSSATIERLAKTIVYRRGLPLRLRGVLLAPANGAPPPSPLLSAAACGTLEDLPILMKTLHAHRVAICSLAAQKLSPSTLLELRQHGSQVEDALALYEALTGRVPVELLDGRDMSYGRALAESRFQSSVQSAVGAVCAAAALLLAAPLMLVVALAIKLDSRGPVFYRQDRVGLYGKSFGVFKFRSMRVDSESVSGPVWAQVGDPRITRVGRILRTLRIDELPQLFNVLSGDMALVGPRPERPHFVSLLEEKIPYYRVRHGIRPGITGWAQVCAGYGASVDESQDKLEYDLFYLKNRSLLLDALVVLKTVKIVICGKGAR